MHKVISFEDALMTRRIILQNIETGTIDECFDDSALVDDKSFAFMELEKQYDCKIKLFGNVVEQQEGAVLCKIICRDIVFGEKRMIKVSVCDDEYYLSANKVKDMLSRDWFYFEYSRKDLVQVNDIIHADYK